LDIPHPQCHFGLDTPTLAQQGARVTGVDFSPKAIEVARDLAAEPGLAERAAFVLSNAYDMPTTLPRRGAFDRVFVSWGALC
jgi:2-polyprenyl-3-methyl-5-hydroxy-6-metoxy-1,4-benzoquinol methylase